MECVHLGDGFVAKMYGLLRNNSGIDEDETPGGGGGRRRRWRSWQWTVSISAMGLLQKCVGY